jgi:hypothetical protein
MLAQMTGVIELEMNVVYFQQDWIWSIADAWCSIKISIPHLSNERVRLLLYRPRVHECTMSYNLRRLDTYSSSCSCVCPASTVNASGLRCVDRAYAAAPYAATSEASISETYSRCPPAVPTASRAIRARAATPSADASPAMTIARISSREL